MQTPALLDLVANAANRYAQLFEQPSPIVRPPELEKPRRSDEAQISLADFQSLKFEFFYEKVISTSRGATFLQGDEARSISQDLYQKVSGRFSFDFSILSTVAEQTGRAASIDEETFKKFVQAANGLATLNDDSLQKFLGTVDEIFNAAEQALGLSSEGLDDFADLIKDSVKGFFSEINSAVDRMRTFEKSAAKDFSKQLQALLEPPKEKSKILDGVRKQLGEAGVPDRLRSSLMKIAKLLSRLARAEDPEKQEALLNRLQRVTNRALKEVDKMADEEEGAASQPQALYVQQYTETVERFSLNIQQMQLDLAA
jgi:hypothetical protein